MEKTVWVLLGRKAGDNNQVLALAEALGWPYEEKRIQARGWELLPHLLLRVTLAGIDRRASSPLSPPWPDMVISAGRRNEPVARWIRRRTGGRTRLVHIGRPWAPLDCYDLIVTTPQYFLPERDNVLHNTLPLHRVRSDRVAAAARRLQPELAALPHPLTTVLIGGDSGPFVFTPDKGRRLAEGVNRLVAQTGGSVLVTDSRRTSAAAAAAFRNALKVPAATYWWDLDNSDRENPYLAYLGLGERFVVTGESMSMLAEAAAMGRPLYLFDPGDPPGTWWLRARNFRHQPLSHRLAMRLAPLRMRRDVGRIQQALVDAGRARWLEQAPELIAQGEDWYRAVEADSGAELERTAQRVRLMMGIT
ncbi:nucleoside-diphosphate-sugar epimerase [Thiohalobacter thiocyanaticus]|uniref:Nucleoside-diphosphate-sugar epimerase n=1 Tax=Thiohalobacter thiocyanaticus TaxID=585455 RepID=A0A1Z4VPX1_9GAMM|nr:mitochondrial fission ELM1 family protein [Thiohalobacter thiocyanaticus]BAZ93680.1 nucleoside-diphosphate-sugar epimerase [Thiohalobacter thiocyanaticus]